MITAAQCLKKYGEPETEAHMTLWNIPPALQIGVIPKKIYCNKDMVFPLSRAFQALIKTGAVKELRTYDGCFNIRAKRGGKTPSLHSFGIAIDLNASDNQFGKSREQLISEGRKPFSDQFVKCFTDNGFDWGGVWLKADCMHFQLASI